jgi:thioredoxin
MTLHLDAAAFREKVFDYEKGGDWRYLGELPALIDFYAEWCGPCKSIAPTLEALSDEFAGKVSIYKVDTDREQELAMAFGVQSVPTLVFVPKEGQPRMAVGALTKKGFEQAFAEIFGVTKEAVG